VRPRNARLYLAGECRIMPRLVLFLLICVSGTILDVVLILKFHSYRAPAIVFVAMLAVGTWILRKPPSGVERKWTANRGRQRTVKRVRRIAYIFMAFYVLGWVSFLAQHESRNIAVWKEFLISLIPAFCFIVYPLWLASRLERIPESDWNTRFGLAKDSGSDSVTDS
jgi:hypothetical protein